MTEFNAAFERLIGHEGELSLDSRDRGNWTSGIAGKGELKGTKYGVSAMSYPGEDIAGLTLERAQAIYLRDYWGPAGCDALPPVLRFDVFDMAVNSGIRSAIRALQRTVGTVEDGILGPHTLMAAQSMPPLRLAARFNAQRLLYYASLATWPAFGRGWGTRVAQNLMEL